MKFFHFGFKVKKPTLSPQNAAGKQWGTLFDDAKQKGRRL
jgi:hypothetical protein